MEKHEHVITAMLYSSTKEDNNNNIKFDMF